MEADVAALIDIMGNAKLGGDWDLEVQRGNNQRLGIKKRVIFSRTCCRQCLRGATPTRNC